MELRILGNVEIYASSDVVPLSRGGERCVLAALALSPARRVHTDALIEYVWGSDPPSNAERTIASYVRTVRRAIELAGGQRSWLSNHRPRSYQLDIAPDLIDYHRFTALTATARVKQRDGKLADAVGAYDDAVMLRRGEALANVTGQWAEHRRYALEMEYLDVVCTLYEQQLALGQSAAVATNAVGLITTITPTDRMITLAVRALAGSGQHGIIRDFVARASRRMWETVEARPGTEVIAIAQRLAAGPDARPMTHSPAAPQVTTAQAVESDASESDSGQQYEPARPDGVDAVRHIRRPVVMMTATNNGVVYQSAGDQYINADADDPADERTGRQSIQP